MFIIMNVLKAIMAAIQAILVKNVLKLVGIVKILTPVQNVQMDTT